MQKIIFLLLIFPSLLFSQNKLEYAAMLIPADLLENANAVIRQQQIEFAVQSPGKASYKEHRVVTIFNEKSGYDAMVVHYDPSNKLGRIKGNVYDAMGNFVREIEKKEIRDVSAISSFSIYEDNRVRYVDVDYTNYPYTVEFEYEMSYKDLLFYPGWQVNEFSTAVQSADLVFTLPINMKLHYKTLNLDVEPIVSNQEKNQQFKWTVENIKAVKYEPYCPARSELLSSIMVSPGLFEAENYTGSMSSWNDFGEFMNLLMQGRDELSPAMKMTVQKLIENAETDREKIAALYRYLQENMRYVSVQLGIGGWQPFDAQYVEANKYGDCKALSNFMKALLKEAGITAYPVLIHSGKQPFQITEDFTTPRFNHMIVHVPSEDYWLECTSNSYPPNYIGSSNSDRNVLLITEAGGRIGRTPVYQSVDNREDNLTTIHLDENGEATVNFSSNRKGSRQEWYRNAKESYSEADLRKEIMESIPLPSFTLDELSVSVSNDEPKAQLEYQATVQRYASKAGKRLFVPLNAVNPYSSPPPSNDERLHPVVVENGYSEKDSIVFHLPVGYHVESMPPTENILENDIGKYSLKLFQDQYTLTVVRELEVKAARIPAADYMIWRDFFKEVGKLDGSKLVLVGKS
ncbi:MAG: DUF3857 and transglutaminase domain-containing protein [Saprospiraceae bacterium]